MTYQQLENLSKMWKGKVCIYGFGLIGRTWAHDIIQLAGFKIDYYCDKRFTDNKDLQSKNKKISINDLFNLKENVLVFIAVSNKFQKEVIEQIKENNCLKYISIDYCFFSNWIESVLNSGSQETIKKYYSVTDDKEYLKKQFYYKLGYDLNMENPQTFNEKLQWLKLNDRNLLYTTMVDKYAVKEYVSKIIGKEYVIPTLGVWDNFDEIDFNNLPNRFVLKCTHDSGSVFLINNKNQINYEIVRDKLEKNLNINYYWLGREWPYKNVPPRILAESYVENKAKEGLIDYKFYCFNGEPQFLYVSKGLDNHTTAKISFLTLEWEFAKYERNDFKELEKLPVKPKCFDEMIHIAKRLSKNLPFVRVDLYEVDGQVLFSELTLTPSGGFMSFKNKDHDVQIGKMLELKREI